MIKEANARNREFMWALPRKLRKKRDKDSQKLKTFGTSAVLYLVKCVA